MKKKLALIVISLDECFPKTGFSGGGHKVTKNLILGLIASNLFEIDIFCKKSCINELEGVNSIKVLGKKTFVKELENELALKSYDYLLSSDILLPFGNLILHSNSAKFKTKNGKNKIQEFILKIYNSKKIRVQEKCFKKNDKNIFTVSQSLKEDYVQNYGLSEERVLVSYPAVDEEEEFCPPELKSEFIFGNFAGGGLNKGGYLMLFALNNLKKSGFKNLKTRVIFPKMHKAFLYKFLIKALGLGDVIELLPKQEDMRSFYRSIDCYVLPSLNEAFGLVVTEAALNSRPSLVSSTTGVSGLVVDGQNGFVFERAQNPLKHLSEGLKRVYNLYFSNYPMYVEISKRAWEMSSQLDWQKFSDTIIQNMKEEIK